MHNFNTLYFFIILFLPLSANSQVTGLKDIIRDPAISMRCKALLKERGDKLQIKFRLKEMIQRNKKLISLTPSNKKTLRANLEINQKEVINYLKLTEYKIKNMEENIIRKGCPGINL